MQPTYLLYGAALFTILPFTPHVDFIAQPAETGGGRF